MIRLQCLFLAMLMILTAEWGMEANWQANHGRHGFSALIKTLRRTRQSRGAELSRWADLKPDHSVMEDNR